MKKKKNLKQIQIILIFLKKDIKKNNKIMTKQLNYHLYLPFNTKFEVLLPHF